MTIEQLLLMLGGISISVIGYFLKSTLEELKLMKISLNKVMVKVEVVEKEYNLKHAHMTEKFDDLYDAVKDLTKEIKELNKELNDKKKS